MTVNYNDTATGRAWCFMFQYPGKKKGMFGTVYVRLGAPMEEVEAECRKRWDGVFPFPPPNVVQLVPGSLVFVPENT